MPLSHWDRGTRNMNATVTRITLQQTCQEGKGNLGLTLNVKQLVLFHPNFLFFKPVRTVALVFGYSRGEQ